MRRLAHVSDFLKGDIKNKKNMQGHKPWAKRQWFYGDWTCAQCGAKIDRLPFNPDPARVDQLLCKDCHRTKMQSFRK